MAGKPQFQLPDPETLQRLLHEKGCEQVAREIGMSGSALGYRARRMGLSTAKGSAPNGVAGNTHTVDVEPGSDLSPDKLLKRVGLDPEEWVITNVKAREGTWGSVEAPNEQLRLEVSVRPVKGMIRPPDLTDWKPLPKPKARKRKDTEPLRAVVISDHHAPRHEKTFHRLFVQWLRDHQPDHIHVNGDLLDLPTVSTHRTEEEYNHSVNECLRAAVHILRDYRHACPDARITLLRGNHCNRLDYYAKDKAPETSNIKAGGGETPEGEEHDRTQNDLRELLYLDYWHIEYATQEWSQAKVPLNRRLTSRHGFSTSPQAGKIMLDKLSGSTIQGHDHRLALTLRTRHTGDEDDPLEVRLAMSGGCACEIPGGLGYINGGEPDWQNGAVAVDMYDNDDFYCSPMIYVPGRMLTREGRYTA
jgi:hypothetical protein